MHYEINVALNSKHLFATAERSITDRDKLVRVYNTFEKVFPKEEGYILSITFWQMRGKPIPQEEMDLIREQFNQQYETLK